MFRLIMLWVSGTVLVVYTYLLAGITITGVVLRLRKFDYLQQQKTEPFDSISNVQAGIRVMIWPVYLVFSVPVILKGIRPLIASAGLLSKIGSLANGFTK